VKLLDATLLAFYLATRLPGFFFFQPIILVFRMNFVSKLAEVLFDVHVP
jgi:hypothetical protein